MAAKKAKAVTGYEIKVVGNTEFCGVGAGGVQFAYGKAQITGAAWWIGSGSMRATK